VGGSERHRLPSDAGGRRGFAIRVPRRYSVLALPQAAEASRGATRKYRALGADPIAFGALGVGQAARDRRLHQLRRTNSAARWGRPGRGRRGAVGRPSSFHGAAVVGSPVVRGAGRLSAMGGAGESRRTLSVLPAPTALAPTRDGLVGRHVSLRGLAGA